MTGELYTSGMKKTGTERRISIGMGMARKSALRTFEFIMKQKCED